MKPGRILGLVVAVAAALSLGLVLRDAERHPRTDDATVRANFIPVVAEVEGRLAQLPVRDNALVKKGDLLFEIDPRSYQYALESAESDLAALDQEVVDQQRHIAAETSASEAASAEARHAGTSVKTAGSTVEVSAAAVSRAEAAVVASRAHLDLAVRDVARLTPLLPSHYVTAQQVDEASTAQRVAEGELQQAQAALDQARQQQRESQWKREESEWRALAAHARSQQAAHGIDTLDTLQASRLARVARVEIARLSLERTRVVAPFDAYVTNLNISEGAYAHTGAPLFTLIDTRTWYVLASYREGKLRHVPVGARVDVFLPAHPERRFDGVVESVSYGVFPDDGNASDGLPEVSRTLNWVHLSARFPVRIRITGPDTSLLRIGESAVTTIR